MNNEAMMTVFVLANELGQNTFTEMFTWIPENYKRSQLVELSVPVSEYNKWLKNKKYTEATKPLTKTILNG